MGSSTTYNFLYMPDFGSSGQDEVDLLNAGFNKVDAHLDKTLRYGASTAGNDTYAISTSPSISAYRSGQIFAVLADTANTGTCTLNVDSQGAVNIQKWSESAWVNLDDGDIHAGKIFVAVYDGTRMQFVGQLPQRIFEYSPFVKTTAGGVRIKDTGGKDIFIRVNGNNLELCDNTGTESSPSWAVRLTISGSTGLPTMGTATNPTTANDLARYGWVQTQTDKYIARMYLSSNASFVNATVATVGVNTTDGDSEGICNTSTHRMTPNRAGYYLVYGSVQMGTGSSCGSGSYVTFIRKNGSSFARSQRLSIGTIGTWVGGEAFGIVYCNGSTDYLDLAFYQSTGYTQNLGGGWWCTYLQLVGLWE